MNMRKRRKHIAGIPGRDSFTRCMWMLGVKACFIVIDRRWVQAIKWSNNTLCAEPNTTAG